MLCLFWGSSWSQFALFLFCIKHRLRNHRLINLFYNFLLQLLSAIVVLVLPALTALKLSFIAKRSLVAIALLLEDFDLINPNILIHLQYSQHIMLVNVPLIY